MAPQDTFFDDEEETCPLCIEEFDLSDRNFRPCPCGYQICQFCFNNIKNNMNSLCPACRRPYDEKTIQWKVVTQEEIAEFRANIQRSQKKRAVELKQKEAQKREAEKDNRKNLVGVRVVQKNLVYVTGLTPTVREDELLKTLRQHQFFGQYGNIQKISISNRKNLDGQNQSMGIYVTFERKEDAAKCIQAVNGSHNGDRVLRAQLGTTKYCSAWLRHEQCTNRQCMFLHELGDEEDSYSRQDLSSMNSISSQRPLAQAGSSRSVSRQQPHPSPAPQAAQPMVRSNSRDESENGDGSALPSSANWARNPQVRSRRGSHATSGAAPSPAISHSLPVTAESPREAIEDSSPIEAGPSTVEHVPVPAASKKAQKSPVAKARSLQHPALVSLLRSMSRCKLAWPKLDEGKSLDDYPPYFDPRGGMRRRAMRAREYEETAPPDELLQAVDTREPSEGEPESSGSLALGGEPEDREHAHDRGFDLRRGTQPPIQRANADSLFGPALGSGFSQPASGLGSVGSRTMTPQQPGFMRSQGAFADHLPPGLTSQANLFQGQGHSRQGSRFSFANDSRDTASSTSVKLTGNARIMAQQSSMMPSSFHNQPGNPFFASSMPGPPPGLKSTGTPPNMFGQHGFGGAFGGASKDSSEFLQILNRGRGAGAQAHDAGKREYMFHSFSNQYPPSNSSTPAPAAPGLLGPLHGALPGAFQDYGSKQKKKGKKHRHANTSSSGGSGLVDLADPSILQVQQARMQQSQQHLQQQQQQSGGGLAPGLFAAQAQDDDLLSSEAAIIVDRLVSDEPVDANIRQPPGAFETFGRTSTPSAPPGLSRPVSRSHASPAASISSGPGPSGGRRTPPVPTPVTKKAAAASPPASTPSSSTPVPAASTSTRPLMPSAPEAKKLIKTLAVESGLSGDIAKAKLQKALQDEDFPALGTPKAPQPSAAPSPAPKDKTHKSGTSRKAADKSQDKGKATVVTPAASIPPKAESRATDKRPTPGTLNIAAATKAAQTKTVEPSSAVDKLSADKEFPALPTPTATSVASPITRAAPKTLRVVPTPKTELPPAAPVLFAPSARTSAAIRPETPVSELISDSASIISASISASRTNSPPPSKVGSAPVRTTTKSQQRKNRKEALKKESAEIASQPVKETDAEIGPIVGRKKKQKKEKEKMTKTIPTPAASRPGSPPPTVTAPEPIKEAKDIKEIKEVKEAKEVTETKEETSAYRSTAHETTSLTEDTAPARKADGKAKASDQYPNPQSVPTPAAVLHDLQQAGLLPANIDDLAFFKPTSWQADNVHHHASVATDDNTAKNVSPSKSIVSDEDQVELLSGNAVRKIMDGVRILLTPNGDCIRHLTEEEENRFLELQKSIAEMAGNPAAFVSARHEAGVGFSLIKGRAVPNGPPSYFPPAPGAFPSDPVNKIQREEAIYYINQYVLPRLNLNSRDMNLPRAMAGWSIDSKGKPHPSGVAGAAGAAAASLAPWMYGANGMPGPSDTAAPELSFPGPSGSFDGMGDHPALAPYLDLPGGASQNIHLPPPEEIAAAMPSVAAHGGARAAASAFGNVPLMSMEDAEQALALARKETDKIDKTLQALMRKNKRLLTMSSSGGH